MGLVRFTIIIVAVHLLASCGAKQGTHPALDPSAMQGLARSGDGFLVWERYQDDEWQIWTKQLKGDGEQRIIPHEEGRDHICPKISPNGRLVAYLSVLHDLTEYNDKPGNLRVFDLATHQSRTLVAEARTYHENRAVVWFDDRRLCYVAPAGDAMELDLDSLKSVRLTSKAHPRGGWLIDRTKHFATTGEPEFAPFDASLGEMHPMPKQGGCQPYFTSDGRWGYWMGGAGGPLNAMHLATRQVTPVLELNDPRLPAKQNYVYFPMISDGMKLVAFGVSDDDHDHFKANYDIYVARLDPQSLDLIGKPLRYTASTGTDRYPDVWQQELPLGTQYVEGPTEITFRTPGNQTAEWYVDSVRVGNGASLKHRFVRKGDHWIEARSSGSTLTGLVHVRRSYAPYVTLARRTRSDRLTFTFSESVSLQQAKAHTDDGRLLEFTALEADDRRCEVIMPDNANSVTLSGVHDLAQKPNVLVEEKFIVPPLSWPQTRKGLIFAWDNKLASSIGSTTPISPERKGKAFWNASGGLDVRGGWAEFAGVGDLIAKACSSTHSLTIEAIIRPLVPPYDKADRPILSLETASGAPQFSLSQRMSTLVLRLATHDNPGAEGRDHLLAQIRSGTSYHFILSYEADRVTMYLNGSEVWVRPMVDGHLKFSNEPCVLRIGSGAKTDEASRWPGTLEHLALYNRVLTASEAMGHADLATPLLAGRSKERQRKVKLKLIETSRLPELKDISPYREALTTFLYEVLPNENAKDKQEIPVGTKISVAHWVWVSGERVKPVATAPGTIVELFVDPLQQHVEVTGIVMRNDLKDGIGTDQYFDASNW